MADVRYTADYDSRLGLYRWQIAPGARLPAAAPPSNGRAVRVVALGGGTGLPIVLKGLKAVLFPPGWIWIPARDRDRLAAVVTVADDGGSSGRLRRDYRMLPPGDVRNCLLALTEGDPTMAAIFNFRFGGDGELEGHSLGNLILTALSQLEGSFPGAVARGGEMLAIRGRVFPSSVDEVTLRAEFADGSLTEGESRITAARRPIQRLTLEPADARAFAPATQAVAGADVVVIGPGSLYTSLIPILLVRELAAALAASKARVVLVMNLMTEPGETDGYSAADHLLALRRHAPELPVRDVLLNETPIPAERLEPYAAAGAHPVTTDPAALRDLGCRPVARDLLGSGPLLRHDPLKLARAVVELAAEAAA